MAKIRIEIPVYQDGYFDLYKVTEDTSADYPVEVLTDMQMQVWFRTLNVYDRLRYEMNERGKEVTMKIRIPQYTAIDSHYLCKIDGIYHEVYNAAHNVASDGGFPESELTLIRPENNRIPSMEIITND